MTEMTNRKLILILILVFSLLGFKNSYAELSKTVEVAIVKINLKELSFSGTKYHGVEVPDTFLANLTEYKNV
jgi:hypothetical protein